MKHLVIIGARGFGREVLWSAKYSQESQKGEYDIKGFLDDKEDALDGYKGNFPPILGSVETYVVEPDDVFFCALGDPHYRKKYADIIEAKGGKFVTITSPLAVVSGNATIGTGSIIGAFSIVSDNVVIGKHVMIQSYVDLGHDSMVGDYASLESYVFLGGYAQVGSLSVMHTRSTLIPHKKIGENVSVGVASVVMRNVKDGFHVFGNPAIRID